MKRTFTEPIAITKYQEATTNLIFSNEFFDFNYAFKFITSWNLWNGFGEITVSILPCENEKTHSIHFSISILRALSVFAILNIVFGIILFNAFAIELLYFFILFNVIAIASYFIKLFRFKHFFNKTIKFGSFYEHEVIGNKNYNWELILQNKSISELMQIINGRTLLPDIVIQLAKKELKNRNDNNKST